jgi:bifunctional non-homologous end joining protein LigD
MATRKSVPIPVDPREWRPQLADGARGVAHLDNPIAEPIWNGTRVLAYFHEAERDDEWGSVEVIDEEGDDGLDSASRAFDQLRRSILARDAVIDGIITDQTLDSGVSMEFDPTRPSPGKDVAFVALDLLSVDGLRLFDIPLLERKRLLESVIRQSPLVRLSPWVTPPIDAWLRTWRAAGFKGAMLKSANSRYVPGSRTVEWAVVEHGW